MYNVPISLYLIVCFDVTNKGNTCSLCIVGIDWSFPPHQTVTVNDLYNVPVTIDVPFGTPTLIEPLLGHCQ